MKPRFPLYLQTASFLLLHLFLLAALFLVFFNTQFGMGWDAIFYSPVGERVEAIAWTIHQQVRTRPVSTWNEVLDEFAKFYGVKLYIFDRLGKQVAGEPVILPEAVLAKFPYRQFHDPDTEAAVSANMKTGPGTLTTPPSHHGPHGRFLLHTASPDCFWIGTPFRLGHPGLRSSPDGISPGERPGFRPGPEDMQPGERPGFRPGPEHGFVPGVLIAAAPNLLHTRLTMDFGPVLAAIGAVLLFSILLWWPFVYRITRSLAQLTAMTERIAEGRFDTRLKASRWDEIGCLSEAVNGMAERLSAFVAGQKRFLGDTAHELCSPIARLQVALELLESVSTAEQERTIKDIREDVEEMSSLINELLAFSKAGLQGREIELSAVNLEALLQGAVQKTCAENLFKLSVPADLCALGDQLLLERAFGNILRNGVRYAAQDGPICIKGNRLGDEILVTVTDNGPGVPAEAIKLLGQPFFRPEPSRSRSSGGVGLGLAIVKTCVDACGGSFKIRNHQPHGLEVEVRLKAAQRSEPAATAASATGSGSAPGS